MTLLISTVAHTSDGKTQMYFYFHPGAYFYGIKGKGRGVKVRFVCSPNTMRIIPSSLRLQYAGGLVARLVAKLVAKLIRDNNRIMPNKRFICFGLYFTLHSN